MEEGYAQALWKVIQAGTSAQKAVHALTDTLKARGRLALSPRIAKAFGRIAARESAREGLVLTIAQESDQHHAHAEAKKVFAEIGVVGNDMPAHAGLKTEVDDTLIGGWRLEGRGTLIDASYKKQLLDIFSSVTGA